MYAFTMFLLLLLLSFEASSFSSVSFRSRSLLRAINTNTHTSRNTNITIAGDQPHFDYVVDLNSTNFDALLQKTPAHFAIVEFYAHWCPACRNYKPQYEKVAKIFNGPNAVHPGMILVTKVDCAEKINTNLCDKFSVDRFPMLFWGPPSHFASFSKTENSTILYIDDRKTADRILNWINNQLGSSYSLDDERHVNKLGRSDILDPKQIVRAAHDIEEATYMAFDLILELKMIKSKTRASFIEFLQLIVAHHPSRRCRKGSANILVNFDDLCPSEILSGTEQECMTSRGKSTMRKFQICGSEVPRGYWKFCRGSRNDTRGFSCGLWVLLHSLSVRIENGESQMAFTTTCEFIHNFFICDDCRQHFHDMCLSVSSPFKRTRDYALWLWTAHNKVNKRLMKEEASLGTGDPKFPKIFWPPKQLCPSCYFVRSHKNGTDSQIDWNLDEVFRFLANYYGNTLPTLYKDKELLVVDAGENKAVVEELESSTDAAFPLGAAFAIALAGCTLGALACLWRSRQKNWKRKKNRIVGVI